VSIGLRSFVILLPLANAATMNNNKRAALVVLLDIVGALHWVRTSMNELGPVLATY
jgi:hypothetical protein